MRILRKKLLGMPPSQVEALGRLTSAGFDQNGDQTEVTNDLFSIL